MDDDVDVDDSCVVLASWADAQWDRDGDVMLAVSIIDSDGDPGTLVVDLHPVLAWRMAWRLAAGGVAAAVQRGLRCL